MTSSIPSEHCIDSYKILLISQYFLHLEHYRAEIWYIGSMTNVEQLLIQFEF